MSKNGFLKPVCVGGIAVALDKYVMGEQSLQRSAIFGAVVASGSYVSEMVAPSIVPNLPSLNSEMYNGKKVGERVTELTVMGSSVFVVNKYLLRNDIYRDELLMRVGVIVVSDIVGEYIADYIDGRPLQYLE
jgi:hypothetical protein